jgi:adenylate kinase family enzyme
MTNILQILFIGITKLKNKEIILIHGTPGAGKDTNALRFSQEYPSTRVISINNVLRSIISGRTQSQYSGIILKDIELKHKPRDYIWTKLVIEAVSKNFEENYLILGFLQKVGEFKKFIPIAERNNLDIKGSIFLEASNNKSIERMISRGLRPHEQLQFADRDNELSFYENRLNTYNNRAFKLKRDFGKYTTVESINTDDSLDAVYKKFSDACNGLLKQRIK